MKDPATLAKKRFVETRRRALKNGMEFTLPVEWFVERFTRGRCALTGMDFEFSNGTGKTNPFTPSVDRIDSAKGYTPDNCRVILTGLNIAINHWGQAAFLPIARALVLRNV